MDQYVKVGYTKKAFGVKGEIKLLLDDQFIDDCFDSTVLFIELKGKQVPYFIEYMKEEKVLIAKFEDVDSKEATVLISGKSIFLRESDITIQEAPPSDLAYAFVEGFTMMDETLGNIGIIEAIEAFPQQEMALLLKDKNTFYIPLNEQFIRSIDQDKKIIQVDLPEGLVE